MVGPAPAIREILDQTCFTGPRTSSAGDGPILFQGPDPMLSVHSEPTAASIFAPRTTIDAMAQWRAMPACLARSTKRATWSCAGHLPIRWPRVESVESPCCFNMTPPSRSASGWNCARISAACSRAGRLIPEVARGRELISLLRAGAIDGLSIGFRASKARIDPKTRIRRLHTVDLWEISIVTFPLLAGARVRGEACDLKGEAVMRPHARRAAMGKDNRRAPGLT